MKKYVCDVCGYIYDPAEGDPDNNVKKGTAFEAVPEGWVCPLCGAGKSDFSEAQRATQNLIEKISRQDAENAKSFKKFFLTNPNTCILVWVFVN